jgi:hypothetical protein
LKIVVVHRVEGASLRSVLLLRIAWWLEMYWLLLCCGLLKIFLVLFELIKTTTSQNYFEFNDLIWQQENGTPMGSPVSCILAEIFLQNLEAKFYPEMIFTRHIQYIVRYVDDVFIIYDETQTTAQDILRDHNRIHPSMKYKVEI